MTTYTTPSWGRNLNGPRHRKNVPADSGPARPWYYIPTHRVMSSDDTLKEVMRIPR
jgi:hypothetical protein